MADSILDEFFNTPLGEVEAPALLPPGTYIGTVTKHTTRNVKRGETETPRIEFATKILQADADVDPDLLARVDLSAIYAYPGFDLDQRGKFACQNFIESCFPESKGAKIGDYLPMLVGQQVVFKVTHSGGTKVGDDGKPIIYVNYNNLKAFK